MDKMSIVIYMVGIYIIIGNLDLLAHRDLFFSGLNKRFPIDNTPKSVWYIAAISGVITIVLLWPLPHLIAGDD